MNRIARIAAFLCLPCLLGSCGLLNKMLQGPSRLIQSAGRTLSTTDDAEQPPASLDTPEAAAVALRIPATD